MFAVKNSTKRRPAFWPAAAITSGRLSRPRPSKFSRLTCFALRPPFRSPCLAQPTLNCAHSFRYLEVIAALHRLAASISERTPEPLKRPKLVAAQPQPAEVHLREVDRYADTCRRRLSPVGMETGAETNPGRAMAAAPTTRSVGQRRPSAGSSSIPQIPYSARMSPFQMRNK